MSQVDVEVVDRIGPRSPEEKISEIEQDTIEGINVLEFVLNEIGYKIQRFISRLVCGEDAFDEKRMKSLEPDAEAIKKHMEERADE